MYPGRGPKEPGAGTPGRFPARESCPGAGNLEAARYTARLIRPDPEPAMKIKLRNSKAKKSKKTGYRTRQKTTGGRKVNKRQRARHGSLPTLLRPALPSRTTPHLWRRES